MTLSIGEFAALRNLSQKKAGQTVDFISIANARSLTDLGLAERTREGWEITAVGEAALLAHDGPPTAGTASIHTMETGE